MLLDLDGTIIGEILPQVTEWQLLLEYKKEHLRQYRTALIDLLKGSLVRPGMTEFINNARKSNIELFVYTASEHKWANFLVPCVETAIGVTFNRPIFTRNHMVVNPKTGTFQKSITRILPILNRSLKRNGHFKDEQVSINHCLLIDNNETLVDEEMERLVLCPTYKYIIYNDVLRFIPHSVLVTNLGEIAEHLKDNDMFPSVKKKLNIDSFTSHYYEKLGKNMAMNYKTNTENDKMWYALNKIFSKLLKPEKRTELKVKFIQNVSIKLAKLSSSPTSKEK